MVNLKNFPTVFLDNEFDDCMSRQYVSNLGWHCGPMGTHIGKKSGREKKEVILPDDDDNAGEGSSSAAPAPAAAPAAPFKVAGINIMVCCVKMVNGALCGAVIDHAQGAGQMNKHHAQMHGLTNIPMGRGNISTTEMMLSAQSILRYCLSGDWRREKFASEPGRGLLNGPIMKTCDFLTAKAKNDPDFAAKWGKLFHRRPERIRGKRSKGTAVESNSDEEPEETPKKKRKTARGASPAKKERKKGKSVVVSSDEDDSELTDVAEEELAPPTPEKIASDDDENSAGDEEEEEVAAATATAAAKKPRKNAAKDKGKGPAKPRGKNPKQPPAGGGNVRQTRSSAKN